MAKLEGVKVIDMNNGEVTKVMYNGEEYTKVDGDAKKGDLLLYGENQTFITAGYYEVDRLDTSDDAQIIDEDGDEYDTYDDEFEVFRKVNESTKGMPTAERLKVGDLAKVVKVGNAMRGHKIGNIVRVSETDRGDSYKLYPVTDAGCYVAFGDDSNVERYTPQAGDKLTIDGVEYTLEERVAEVGEKVIVVAATITGDNYKNYDVLNVVETNSGGIYYEKGKGGLWHREYLVLSPTTTESKVADEYPPITFVIKTKTGDTFEVLAEDSDTVTASAFADEYLYQDELTSLVFLSHPDVFVPYENIASITVKGA